MKKTYLSVLLGASIVLGACGNSGQNANTTDSTTSTTSTTNTMGDTGTAGRSNMADTGMHNNAMASTSSTPLAASDKDFVMKAAKGGMTEVESSKIAQENATSDRVKNFANMMIQDHTKANDELKSLASSKGLTIPQDSLMNKMKDHFDAMRKMKGQAFDSHYKSMMLDDHKKDVSDFEKASKTLKDADLKAWATKTLPTLKMHLDSAQAMNKSKM